MHERCVHDEVREIGKTVPQSLSCGHATIRIDRRATVLGAVFIQNVVEFFFVFDFNRLHRADQARHSLHHVHLDMAVKQEVTANLDMLLTSFFLV